MMFKKIFRNYDEFCQWGVRCFWYAMNLLTSMSIILVFEMGISSRTLAEELTSQAQADNTGADNLAAEFNLLAEDQKTVVTATKHEQRIEEAPSIIDTITSTEIRQRGYRTVGEALRSVPGFAVIDDHVNYNVGIRGIYAAEGSGSDILKVMINGQPVAFRPYSSNFFAQDLIPIQAVKRIEIIRGPVSALYGANAFLGVINIITFDGEDLNNTIPTSSATLEGFYRNEDGHQTANGGGTLTSGWKKGPFQYFIAATYHYEDRSNLLIPGYEDIVNQHLSNQGAASLSPVGYPSPGWSPAARDNILANPRSKNDIERLSSIYATTQYNFGESIGAVAVDGLFQYFDRFGEFLDYSYLTHNNRIAQYNWYTRARYSRPARDTGFSVSAYAAVAGGGPTPSEHLANVSSQSYYQQLKFSYVAFDLGTELGYAFSKKYILSGGIDLSDDLENLIQNVTINSSTGFKNYGADYGKKSFLNTGLYLQFIMSPIDALQITLGTRIDYNSAIACDSGSWDCFGKLDDKVIKVGNTGQTTMIRDRGLIQMTNRAGVVYQIPISNLYTKLLYGSSFKPPSPYQLYHDPLTVSGTQGYPYLKPQRAQTIEWQIGDQPIKGLKLSLNIAYTYVEDMVLFFMEGGITESRNANAAIISMEANASYHPNEKWTLYLNGGYLPKRSLKPQRKSDETSAGWQFSPFNVDITLPMYPVFSANFGFNVLLLDGHFNFNCNGHFIGPRDASPINTQLYKNNLLKSYSFSSYVVFDFTLSTANWRPFFNRETVVSLSLYNVPGHNSEPGFGGIDIPGLGPEVFFSIEQKF